MSHKEYAARKMVKSEFSSYADTVKRTPDGALCHFACEHQSGAAQLGLSWTQAVEMAETMNAYLAVAEAVC